MHRAVVLAGCRWFLGPSTGGEYERSLDLIRAWKLVERVCLESCRWWSFEVLSVSIFWNFVVDWIASADLRVRGDDPGTDRTRSAADQVMQGI